MTETHEPKQFHYVARVTVSIVGRDTVRNIQKTYGTEYVVGKEQENDEMIGKILKKITAERKEV
jgi:hypothetical protein